MELVDVYNGRHEPLGYQKKRKELDKGEYRLSAFIWIINDQDELLIQQRLSTTNKFPDMWGATAGGVRTGESSLEGIIREAKEELGITLTPDELEFIGSTRRDFDYVEVWICQKNIPLEEINIDKEEVQDVKWVSIDEFRKMLKNGEGIKTAFNILEEFNNPYYK